MMDNLLPCFNDQPKYRTLQVYLEVDVVAGDFLA